MRRCFFHGQSNVSRRKNKTSRGNLCKKTWRKYKQFQNCKNNRIKYEKRCKIIKENVNSGCNLCIDLFYNLQQGNAKTPLFGFYVIVSPSIFPTINVNDAIVVHRQEGSEIDVGDIITFSSTDSSYPGLTVTHRVVKKDSVDSNSYVFRTKGDNNFSEDPSLVKDENIYGKVIFKIPNVGYVRQFLSTGIGFVLLVVFPCVVIILSEIRRIIRLTKLKTSSQSFSFFCSFLNFII